MTFILTFVCIEPLRPPEVNCQKLVVEPAIQDDGASARAGYLQGIARFFDNKAVQGLAYHIVTDDGSGYRTSNAFFAYGALVDEPARLAIPQTYRQDFELLLNDFLIASSTAEMVLIAEDNGHVTAPDLTEEELETIDRIGPIDRSSFWNLLDLGQIFEDSVVTIVGER